MITVESTEILRVRNENLKRIIEVKSSIDDKIQYFNFTIEGSETIIRCDLALLKYRYRIEANEVEILVGEKVMLNEENEQGEVGNWCFDEAEMVDINQVKAYPKVKFQKIGFVFPYAYTKNMPSKIALITTEWNAVFLTLKDFTRLTGFHINEYLNALGCYLWALHLEVDEKDECQQNYIQTMSTLPVNEVVFRYSDTYDKLRVTPIVRQDEYIYKNQNLLRYRYNELKGARLLSKTNTDTLPDYEDLNDAFDGFPDAHWNID